MGVGGGGVSKHSSECQFIQNSFRQKEAEPARRANIFAVAITVYQRERGSAGPCLLGFYFRRQSFPLSTIKVDAKETRYKILVKSACGHVF